MIQVDAIKISLSQPADCCAPNSAEQILEIEAWDGGGGTYYTLKTDRWSFETADELREIVAHFIDTEKSCAERVAKINPVHGTLLQVTKP